MTLNTGFSVGLTGSPYELKIRADRAPGVGPNTPIRKDGVLIGRVMGVEFLQAGGVLITADIQPDAPIYETDECRISPSSLFGDAVVSFAYAAGEAYPEPIAQDAIVEGEALPNPVEALTTLQVDVGPTLASVGEAADGVAELMNRLNRSLGDALPPSTATKSTRWSTSSRSRSSSFSRRCPTSRTRWAASTG